MHRYIVKLAFLFAVVLLLLPNVMAQEETPEAPPIEFSGIIEEIDLDAGIIVVGGLTVAIEDILEIDDDVEISIGEFIEVTGVLQNGVVIAIIIDDDDDDDDIETPTPEATAEATPDAESTAEAESTEEPVSDDDDDSVIIVIEGPVTNIEVNIVTIFNFEIELDDDDLLLTVIEIGDILRVEGEVDEITNITIVIIPITIVIVDVDVFILDGEIWRDRGNCDNPPPPWAPANGWRERCDDDDDDVNINIITGPTGGGGDGGGGDDDDDDDD